MVVSALFALVSCAPQAFVVSPEMRGPSKSGLNLAGKSLAVVYLTDGNPRGVQRFRGGWIRDASGRGLFRWKP